MAVTQAEDDPIDVRELIARLSLDELNAAAEAYFADRPNPEALLAKPFVEIGETVHLLRMVGLLLDRLRPLPGMRVLEFGAGTCWFTRMLAQLGARVVALDVSRSALRLGRELFERQPLIGERFAPEFLEFDGRRIDLPDDSVDRVFCLDAFHHVPNQADVLRELARILRDGGLAGFAEPGPVHSRSAQSQHEMRTATVIENDIIIEEIWQLARAAGFTHCEIALFDPSRHSLSVETFNHFLAGECDEVDTDYLNRLRRELRDQRVFFLRKGDEDPLDSRQSTGLAGELAIEFTRTELRVGDRLEGVARIKNVGAAVWRHHATGIGGVGLGAQLFDADGNLEGDFFRCALTENPAELIRPGDEVVVPLSIPAEGAGTWRLKFGLIAEGVNWFEVYGTNTVEVVVHVAG